MKRAAISIAIPVYNVEKYLERCLDSVLAQTIAPYEVIMVDDGSTDHSGQICERYAMAYPTWKVIHKANAGLGMARNTGMDIAEGTHIIWLDSDDTLQPFTIELYERVIESLPHTEMAIGGFKMVAEENPTPQATPTFRFEQTSPEDLQYKFLLRAIKMLAPGTLYSLRWLRAHNLRFDTVPYSEDQLFLWQAVSKVKNVAICSDSVYNYLMRPGSLMTASKYESIRKCYSYFHNLELQLSHYPELHESARRYFLSRWVYGILHSSAKLCSREEYMRLLSEYDADRHMNNLKDFPDIRVRIMAGIYKISKGLFINISKRF